MASLYFMSRVVTEEGRREALLPARLHLRSLSRVNADGWRALRLLALKKDTTLNALAVTAFNDLLRKNGKRPSVANPLLPDED